MDAYMIPPFKSNRSSFIELVNGDSLTMAWFSGSKEGQDGVSIVISSLTNDVWSAPDVVSERDGYSNQNPVLFYDEKNETLHLFHSQQAANKGERGATIWHLRSIDGGKNWSVPYEVFSKPGSFPRNRIIRGLDERWIFPMYYTTTDTYYCHIKTLRQDQNPDVDLWGNADFNDSQNREQPSIVRIKDGKSLLRAYMRDRKAQYIYTADSLDDGRTWSKTEKTSLPNNDAGIQAARLSSGRVAIVYNPQRDSRDPIAISLSEDNGITWKYTRILEHEDGSQEFSYPTLLQTRDGKIHVTYTWKRDTIKYSVIDEDWIMNATTIESE